MKRGDTIVEVLFASAILGFVSIVVLSIMQKGMVAGQASLEITLARQAMDAQAEAIRLIVSESQIRSQSGNFNKYSELARYMNNTNPIGSIDSMVRNNKCQLPSGDKFVIDVRDSSLAIENNISSAMLYPRLVYSGDLDTNKINNNSLFVRAEGIWVQAVRSRNESGSKNYDAVDFHIRACWNSPSSPRPTTLATIVRIHDEN